MALSRAKRLLAFEKADVGISHRPVGAATMISNQFRDAIDQWVKLSTWHTNHPSDDERFHSMLWVGENDGPSCFDASDFIDLVTELAHRYHPKLKSDYLIEHAAEKGVQAEIIMGYLASRVAPPDAKIRN
jgi:hypothetical protein